MSGWGERDVVLAAGSRLETLETKAAPGLNSER